MLNKNFALNLSASLSGSAFSFDELILKTKTLFEREGVPGFIRILLAFRDEFVVNHWYQQHGKYCCESPQFRRAGKTDKKVCLQLVRERSGNHHKNYHQADLLSKGMGKLLGSEDEIKRKYQADFWGSIVGAAHHFREKISKINSVTSIKLSSTKRDCLTSF